MDHYVSRVQANRVEIEDQQQDASNIQGDEQHAVGGYASLQQHDGQVMIPPRTTPDSSDAIPQQAAIAQGSNRIASMGPYVRLFGSVEEGAGSFYEVERQLGIDNDNVAGIKQNWAGCVKRVYEALVTPPENPTVHQQKMADAFETKLGKIEAPEVVLTQVAHMVVDCLIDLYTDGDSLRSDQIEDIKPQPEDNGMRANQRLHCILRLLRSTKRIPIDLLSGRDRVVIFVRAPVACEKRKESNKTTNDRRGAEIARGKKALNDLAPKSSTSAAPSGVSVQPGQATTSFNNSFPTSSFVPPGSGSMYGAGNAFIGRGTYTAPAPPTYGNEGHAGIYGGWTSTPAPVNMSNAYSNPYLGAGSYQGAPPSQYGAPPGGQSGSGPGSVLYEQWMRSHPSG